MLCVLSPSDFFESECSREGDDHDYRRCPIGLEVIFGLDLSNDTIISRASPQCFNSS